jgi:hypothetical protein
MKLSCHYCHGVITGQVVSKKVVTAHLGGDGVVRFSCSFDGREASGPILWVAHYRCQVVAERQAARATATGAPTATGIGRMPTVYEVAENAPNASDGAEPGADYAAQVAAARAARTRIDGDRFGDPGYLPPVESDWRPQTTAELEDII